MQINYNYSSPSMCSNNGNSTTLGLSTDLNREEKVSFLGRLKKPLIFRDTMLMLREIVISDNRVKEKERTEFFAWLETEIERRTALQLSKNVSLEEDVKEEIEELKELIKIKSDEIEEVRKKRVALEDRILENSPWGEYYKIEREFWKFIYKKDKDLWYVLDPVISVHKDKVTFEAFSLDESTYGCLSVDMDEFELLQEPKLGTTNIDFSYKLAREIERFRTYNEVNLSINPDGFTLDSNVMPEYVEKKIDLPESWIKGFNQVSSASTMHGIDITISKVDMYNICSYLRQHREKESPRYMKFILEPNKNIKVFFEPFKYTMTLDSIYTGDKKREEKIWGRRRWFVMEKLIPLAKDFNIKLLGFGMPHFVIANMGGIKMTIGFSSWNSNDWVKGTSFNILAGFIGKGAYDKVYSYLKTERACTIEEIQEDMPTIDKKDIISGIGMMFKKGEAFFDITSNKVRFRQLINEPLPYSMYKPSDLEVKVTKLQDKSLDKFTLSVDENGSFIFEDEQPTKHSITIDKDGVITNVNCKCSTFFRGGRNISSPCEHILVLYINAIKYLNITNLEVGKKYKINDILEKILL